MSVRPRAGVGIRQGSEASIRRRRSRRQRALAGRPGAPRAHLSREEHTLDLESLRQPFPADKVKQRSGAGGKKLDYVPIETFLERLLEVAPDYSIENAQAQLVDGVGVATLELVIDGKRGFGTGAMKNPDPDMALKSAVSEAIKNAAKNGFGVGLELWDEAYRKTLDSKRALLGGSEAALKREVFRIGREKTGLDKPTAAQVAKAFGRKAGELADTDVLREILVEEGLL